MPSRQLRQQDDSVDYQFEPVWRSATGSIPHTLLTGFEYQHQKLDTERSTADLANIPDAFAPVPPETSVAGIHFQCDARHSCDNDRLTADYYSLYATDQIDLTDRWKLRAGVRQDWWNTALTPLITVPGRFGTDAKPLLAGVKDTRNDNPVSWNVGTLFKLFPWMSPYAGVSKSHLTNFNSENTQNGVGAPESALQYEAGIKFAWFNDRLVVNTAAFNVKRDNVATATTLSMPTTSPTATTSSPPTAPALTSVNRAAPSSTCTPTFDEPRQAGWRRGGSVHQRSGPISGAARTRPWTPAPLFRKKMRKKMRNLRNGSADIPVKFRHGLPKTIGSIIAWRPESAVFPGTTETVIVRHGASQGGVG
jgi:outer membrane receptor protein involved in Fe transport